MLQNDRLKFLHNPLIADLNINSLRNKVIDLGEILKDLPLDYLVISETKLDESFPNSQLKLNEYEVRARRAGHKHGGGLIEFVRQGFIYKRLKKYEPNYSFEKANFDVPNQNYKLLTDKFLDIVNKHAPWKKKFARGNNAPFINRAFQKEIYVRSRLRNKFWVEPSAKNKAAYKKQRNKCVKIRRKVLKDIWVKFQKKVLKLTKVFGILSNPL